MSTQEGSQDSQFIKQQIKDFPLSSKDAIDLIARLLYLLQAMNDRMDRIDGNIEALNQRITRADTQRLDWLEKNYQYLSYRGIQQDGERGLLALNRDIVQMTIREGVDCQLERQRTYDPAPNSF